LDAHAFGPDFDGISLVYVSISVRLQLHLQVPQPVQMSLTLEIRSIFTRFMI
jgi:hypothetical protein